MVDRAAGHFHSAGRSLAADPRGRTNISTIFLKWLGLGAGITTELDAATFPEYDASLRQSMLEESTRFVSGLVAKRALSRTS